MNAAGLVSIPYRNFWFEIGVIGFFVWLVWCIVGVYNTVNNVSGFHYFENRLNIYILSLLEEKKSSEDFTEFREFNEKVEMLEEIFGGKTEGAARSKYDAMLELADHNLGIPVPAGWREKIDAHLENEMKAVGQSLDDAFKTNDKKVIIESISRSLEGVSLREWYSRNKNNLGELFRARATGKLVESILGWAGIGGTLGLYVGCMISVFRGELGWGMTVGPMVGTICGGYFRSVSLTMSRYYGESLRMRLWRFTLRLLVVAAVLAGISIQMSGGFTSGFITTVFIVVFIFVPAIVLYFSPMFEEAAIKDGDSGSGRVGPRA